MAIGTGLAIGLGMAGAGLIGSKKSSDAAKGAAKDQARSADKATELQREIYYNNLDLTEDQRRIGGAALEDYNRVANDFNYGKVLEQFDPRSLAARFDPSGIRENFRADPGYRFRVDEATKALEGNASARGLRTSGALMQGLNREIQGIASDEYDSYYNRAMGENMLGYGRAMDLNNITYGRRMGQHTDRLNHLASLAGIGQTGTSSAIQAGQSYAGNAGNAMLAAGQARADGRIGQANAFNSGINNLASIFGAYQGGMFNPVGA